MAATAALKALPALLPLLLLSEGISCNAEIQTSKNSTNSTVQGTPTLRPAKNFKPRKDAEELRKALSFPRDEDTLIKILTKRTDHQRREISKYYPDLSKDLHMKTSFAFRDLMVDLTTPMPTIYASLLKEALKFSVSINEELAVELLCTVDNRMLRDIQETYERVTGRTIRAALTKFSINKFTTFLALYAQGSRNESRIIDQRMVMKDAQDLKNLSKLQIENGSTFSNILISRSYSHLTQVFLQYRNITGSSITDAIEKDFSGNVKRGLINILKTIVRRPAYFAEILRNGLKSSFAKDSTLIRILITRSEIDLEDIKEAYKRMYQNSLASKVWSKTSWNFRKALLSLMNVSDGSSSRRIQVNEVE